MQILEQQTVILRDLISYRFGMKRDRLPQFITHATENLGNLGVQQNGRVLFTEDNSREQNIELLIPVDGVPEPSPHFAFQPEFRLVHAVSARHEGSFLGMDQTEKKLMDHIAANGGQMITLPYYSIVRLDADSPGSSIVDILIGLNYNIL